MRSSSRLSERQGPIYKEEEGAMMKDCHVSPLSCIQERAPDRVQGYEGTGEGLAFLLAFLVLWRFITAASYFWIVLDKYAERFLIALTFMSARETRISLRPSGDCFER
jgi:hypothetical protein